MQMVAGRAVQTPATREATMLKPCLTFAAVVLFALTLAPATGGMSQAPRRHEPCETHGGFAGKSEGSLYPRLCDVPRGQRKRKDRHCHEHGGDDRGLDRPQDAGFQAGPGAIRRHPQRQRRKDARRGRTRKERDEMWNLVIYIRSLSKNQPAAAQPAPEPAAQAPAASPAPEPSAQPAPQPATPPAAQPTN